MEPLTPKQIDKELKNLNGWTFEDDKIHKEFTFTILKRRFHLW
jgi:pterin-4a-carbinolamine dehydratase